MPPVAMRGGSLLRMAVRLAVFVTILLAASIAVLCRVSVAAFLAVPIAVLCRVFVAVFLAVPIAVLCRVSVAVCLAVSITVLCRVSVAVRLAVSIAMTGRWRVRLTHRPFERHLCPFEVAFRCLGQSDEALDGLQSLPRTGDLRPLFRRPWSMLEPRDMRSGHAEFDEEFIVNQNNAQRPRPVLMGSHLRVDGTESAHDPAEDASQE